MLCYYKKENRSIDTIFTDGFLTESKDKKRKKEMIRGYEKSLKYFQCLRN
jgi:hypothetical protein